MPYGDPVRLAGAMASKKQTWNQRLVELLEERGISAAALARACGIKRPSMNEWTNGTTKNPRLDNFFTACDHLKIRPRWLALGDPPMEPQPDDAPPPYSKIVMQVADALELRGERMQKHILNLLLDLPGPDPTEATERLST